MPPPTLDVEKQDPLVDQPVLKPLRIFKNGSKLGIEPIELEVRPTPAKSEAKGILRTLQTVADNLRNRRGPNTNTTTEGVEVPDPEKGDESFAKVNEKASSVVEDRSVKAGSPSNSKAKQAEEVKEPVATLYLVEQPHGDKPVEEVSALFSNESKSDLQTFLDRHSKDSITQIGPDAYDEIDGVAEAQEDKHTFFAKWSRPVHQTKFKWKVERVLRGEKSYDLEIFDNPREEGMIVPNSYARIPENSRDYYFLSEDQDGVVYHALNECASFFAQKQGGVYICNEDSLSSK